MPEHTPAPTPHRAVYGFAWFLLFKTLFFVYLTWAIVPDSILENVFGLIYVPDKYFAIQLPVIVMTALMFFAFLIYPGWNLSITADPDDTRTFCDRFTIRRCQTILTNGTICGQKIAFDMAKGWNVQKSCSVHSNRKPSMNTDVDQLEITNYCDCVDKAECFLIKNPDHINRLRAKKTVPSACDLDISDVCRHLYRK